MEVKCCYRCVLFVYGGETEEEYEGGDVSAGLQG